MKIPETIKIGNITYEIKIKKLKKTLGLHKPIKQQIILSENMSEEMTRNTFFHELVHALFFQVGAVNERQNEVLVQSLANELEKLFELKTEKL
jgi:Zn-dependent peptidase ImmA (M78 family)